MEQKLREIIQKVENSQLSDEQKAEVYAELSQGLRSLVWPVLMKHMPEDKLKAMVDDTANVSVDTYVALIEEAVKDGAALKEIDTLSMEALSGVEAVLAKRGIF